MDKVIIYTDGGCRGNGADESIGGYGVVIMTADGNNKKEFKGSTRNTTNNIMELTAAIVGLRQLKRPCEVKLYSDSAYLVNAFNQNWIKGWLKNGWTNSKNQPVKNKPLWLELIELTKTHEVKFIKVAGHTDNEYNNLCDSLANEAMDEEERR